MDHKNTKVPLSNNTQNNCLRKELTRDRVINLLVSYPLLMKYYTKNSIQIKSKIIDSLIKQPSPSDLPGFVYGFKQYCQHIKNPYNQQYTIKIGRTKNQIPQTRICKWQSQDNNEYVEMFTIRSQYNCKLETLVHLFFAYARKVRYINGKKRIEWFFFQQKTLNAAVTEMANQLMEKVHLLCGESQKTVNDAIQLATDDHNQTIHLISKLQNNKIKKSLTNNQSRLLINDDMKMIINKKDSIKNERLLNYLNKKKLEQSKEDHIQQFFQQQSFSMESKGEKCTTELDFRSFEKGQNVIDNNLQLATQYEEFINKLLLNFLPLQNSSLKQLHTSVLRKLQSQQSYQTIVFNHSSTFTIDLQSTTLHTQFVIIFAKRIIIPQQSEITFKIHYSKKRPTKIHMIIVAQHYDGLTLLKVQNHRYGKVLMVEIDDYKDNTYKILDGYFTEKRNCKKLQDLQIEELVYAYCKSRK